MAEIVFIGKAYVFTFVKQGSFLIPTLDAGRLAGSFDSLIINAGDLSEKGG